MRIPDAPLFEISLTIHQGKDDFPTLGEEVFNENGDKVTYRGNNNWTKYSSFYEKDVEAQPPKLWYEIPKFDIERCELEKMSKEELIEMILKTPTACKL
ncbi:MAG: hypothetical protein IKS48_00380 [Eubacterium sp.]|nr:hypothetical protein [Eubacterium sp.]